MIEDPLRRFASVIAITSGRADLLNEIESRIESLEKGEVEILAEMFNAKRDNEREQTRFLNETLDGIRFALVRGMWALTQAQMKEDISIDWFDRDKNLISEEDEEDEGEDLASVGVQKMLIGQIVSSYQGA